MFPLCEPLLVVLVRVVVDDVKESKLVHALGSRYHPQPIPELLLLEVLLRPIALSIRADSEYVGEARNLQVLKIAARERLVSNDLDLALALLRDDHGIAQVSDPSIDLDLVVKKLLESRDVEDLVRGRLRGVDDKLSGCERGGHSHTGLKGKRVGGPSWGFPYLVGHLGLASLAGGTSARRDFLLRHT